MLVDFSCKRMSWLLVGFTGRCRYKPLSKVHVKSPLLFRNSGWWDFSEVVQVMVFIFPVYKRHSCPSATQKQDTWQYLAVPTCLQCRGPLLEGDRTCFVILNFPYLQRGILSTSGSRPFFKKKKTWFYTWDIITIVAHVCGNHPTVWIVIQLYPEVQRQ